MRGFLKLRKILVPHDGDQMSDKAVMYTAEFAKLMNAEIALLHVIEEIKIPPTLLLGNDRILIERARRSITKELEQSWNKFSQEKVQLLSSEKLNVSSDIRTGDPAEQILKYANETGADMIVMGSRRLEGISKIVVALGSVARKVSERALCPVLLVH